MSKKKIIRYVCVITAITAVSLALPKFIRLCSDRLVARILREDEETGREKEEQGSESMDKLVAGKEKREKNGEGDTTDHPAEDHPPEQKEIETEVSAELKDQKKKTQTDRERISYENSLSIQLMESRSGLIESFIGDRKVAFEKAVADHLFSSYGSLYDITRVGIVDLVSEDDTELTYQIQVYAAIGDKEYADYYFCTYNKDYDFYSLYAYQA